LQDYLGKIGLIFLLAFLLLAFLISRFKITPEGIRSFVDSKKEQFKKELHETEETVYDKPIEEKISEPVTLTDTEKIEVEEKIVNVLVDDGKEDDPFELTIKSSEDDGVDLKVEKVAEEEEVDTLSEKLVKDFGEFDPKLELSNYKFPTHDLLKDYSSGSSITIDQEELEENKNTIVETLRNYKIEISQIKATVGPTVTLYEIIPEAGVRISKIKNLEDDIALSLSALGIRIIAPIPGKGTIGIEVPNKNPKMVSMRSVIASPKFQNAEMNLPVALGKTIS